MAKVPKMSVFGSLLVPFWEIFGALVKYWKLSYRVRVSSIQRVGEGQEFDKFDVFLETSPRTTSKASRSSLFANFLSKSVPQ